MLTLPTPQSSGSNSGKVTVQLVRIFENGRIVTAATPHSLALPDRGSGRLARDHTLRVHSLLALMCSWAGALTIATEIDCRLRSSELEDSDCADSHIPVEQPSDAESVALLAPPCLGSVLDTRPRLWYRPRYVGRTHSVDRCATPSLRSGLAQIAEPNLDASTMNCRSTDAPRVELLRSPCWLPVLRSEHRCRGAWSSTSDATLPPCLTDLRHGVASRFPSAVGTASAPQDL